MQKIYLLLRNNRQTGPFSLDELKSQSLRKDDLIWVEGRSAGWSFPYEIETLRHLFPVMEKQADKAEPVITKPSSSKKVFVSLPMNDRRPQNEAPPQRIEDRAEAIRNRVFENEQSSTSLETRYNRPLEEVENNYTSWVFENRKKKTRISKKHILITAIILAGSFSGWKLATFVFSDKPLTTTHVPRPITPAAVSFEVKEEIQIQEQTPLQQSQVSAKTVKELPVAAPITIPIKNEPIADATVSKEQEKKVIVVEVPTDKEVAGNIEPEKSKPGIKEKINNWLKGSKKERENEMGEGSYVDISHKIDLRLIGEQDNWMMGIKGQKLSVSNRSDQKLSAAKVEVSYYSEQNALLDKKMVELENVSPGKSRTITIPDHKMADHIDVKLVSAKGVEE
jgi:hypothetical protein